MEYRNVTKNEVAPGLTSEAELLLVMAEPELTPAAVERCWGLIARTDLNWGAFVDAAARHKLLPLIGRHVTRYGFQRRRADVAMPYPWLFVSAYTGNRERNLALLDEWANVATTLNAAGVRYAIRKGPALVERVYGDPGVRRMNDLDILIDRANSAQVAECLRRAGYEQGGWSEDLQRIEPFTRNLQVLWKVTLNNELPYRKVGHRAGVPTFDIDLCVDIFQRKSGVKLPAADLLARAEPVRIAGVRSWGLSEADALLDLCAHLHKEATSLYYIQQTCDLEISKFLDVALMSRSQTEEAWQRFVERVLDLGAASIVYFALHFTDALYRDSVPAWALARLRPDDVTYLEQYGQSDGVTQEWRIPFPDRLFASHRGDGAGRSQIPKV
jgi:hypothetical protein